MKYLYDVPFSTGAATDKYREGWESTFGKKPEPTQPRACAKWSDIKGVNMTPERQAKLDCEAKDLANLPTLLPGDDCPCESRKAFAQCHGKTEGDPADG